MDYVITFADVMAGLIAVGGTVLTFFIKRWFNGIEQGNTKIQEKIEQNDKKVNERIDRLEQKNDEDLQKIKGELSQMKADLPVVYVLREDYIRVANNMEENMKELGRKIDMLLMNSNKDK